LEKIEEEKVAKEQKSTLQEIELTEKQKKVFWSKVVKTEKCWFWTGRQNNTGYGMFYNDSEVYAHRISYLLLVGPIPPSKPELDHYCYNRNCVNPGHMLPTTRTGNLRNRQKRIDGRDTTPFFADGNKSVVTLMRTHCNNDHKIKYLKVDSKGKARCVDCIDDKERIDLRQNISSTIDVAKFCEESEAKFSKGTFTGVIKQFLREQGIDTYSAKTVQTRRYLQKALQTEKFDITDLMIHYNLKKTNTNLHKNIDGELTK
jgi:hypothetical protein